MVKAIFITLVFAGLQTFSAEAATTTAPVQKTVARQVTKAATPQARTPAAQAQVKPQAVSAPAAYLGGRTPASGHDINEAMDITGQSRNLSMGLMFQRDKDKVSFGSPRTNYKDKITSSQTNY